MTIEHLIAFNIALIAAILSPGPAFLVATKTTLSAGRGAGIAIGCGLGLMAAMWTLAALLGLEIIFEPFPWAYALVRGVGAVYLIYIAVGMWRGARDGIASTMQPARRAFRQGFVINALNPKSVLFAAAVLVVVFPKGMSTAENTIIVLNHLVVEITFYTTLAFALSTPAVSASYLKAKVYIDRTASVILGALGLKLLFGL
jgi:threonine/homoserine/homoserine lactone efflux protein